HYPTTTSCSFKTKPNISANESAVVYINVPGAAAHFTANYKSTMRRIDSTVADNNILNWHPSFSSFSITTAFHTQCIISNIKHRIFDQNIFTTLCLYAAALLRIRSVFYKNISHCQVLTHEWMKTPCR